MEATVLESLLDISSSRFPLTNRPQAISLKVGPWLRSDQSLHPNFLGVLCDLGEILNVGSAKCSVIDMQNIRRRKCCFEPKNCKPGEIVFSVSQNKSSIGVSKDVLCLHLRIRRMSENKAKQTKTKQTATLNLWAQHAPVGSTLKHRPMDSLDYINLNCVSVKYIWFIYQWIKVQ